MDIVLQLSKSNSGATGTFAILAGAAGAPPISSHILTAHLRYSAQGLSWTALLLGN